MKVLIPLLIIILILVESHNKDPTINKHLIPVYGNSSLGYYYINVYVGSPPQQQSVIIDTGSGQFAIPCSQCTSCGRRHIHPPFDIKKSKTNKILTCASSQALCKQSCKKSDSNPCKFSISYAQGSSLSGIVMQDHMQFQIGSIGQDIQTTFGCTTRQTNLFYTQAANGIFGLAPHRNSRVLDMLYQSHTKYTSEDLIFSMCLSQNGGQLTLGGVNQYLNIKQDMIKTTFQDSRNVYTLNSVGEIKINNTVIRSNQDLGYYGMFIDSGSTFTYFKYDKFQKLQTELQNLCALHSSQCLVAKNKEEKNCFKITPIKGQTIKKTIRGIFSPIDININGRIIRWSSDKYFVLRSLKNRQICLAVYGLDRFLLGANWMIDMNIAFNLRTKSISIYPEANCKKKTEIPQPSQHQQLSLYNGQEDKNPLQYFQAIIRQDDYLVTKLVIFIMLILLIFGALILLAMKISPQIQQKKQLQSKVPQKNRQEDERQIIKIVIQGQQSIPSSQRNLNNEQTDEQAILQHGQQKQSQKKGYQLPRQTKQYIEIIPNYQQ